MTDESSDEIIRMKPKKVRVYTYADGYRKGQAETWQAAADHLRRVADDVGKGHIMCGELRKKDWREFADEFERRAKGPTPPVHPRSHRHPGAAGGGAMTTEQQEALLDTAQWTQWADGSRSCPVCGASVHLVYVPSHVRWHESMGHIRKSAS